MQAPGQTYGQVWKAAFCVVLSLSSLYLHTSIKNAPVVSVISFMAITLGLVFGHNGDLCMPSTVGMDNESYFIS